MPVLEQGYFRVPIELQGWEEVLCLDLDANCDLGPFSPNDPLLTDSFAPLLPGTPR